MNVYFVDAGEQSYIYRDSDGCGYDIDEYEAKAYIAAETRGKAHAIAVKLWERDIYWTTPMSIRKVGVTSADAGIIDFEDFYNYEAMVDAVFENALSELDSEGK